MHRYFFGHVGPRPLFVPLRLSLSALCVGIRGSSALENVRRVLCLAVDHHVAVGLIFRATIDVDVNIVLGSFSVGGTKEAADGFSVSPDGQADDRSVAESGLGDFSDLYGC